MEIDWANISVGVAAILGLIYVVREIRGMTKDNNIALAVHTGVMREIGVSLGILNEKTDRLHDDNKDRDAILTSLHDDNVETASILKASDEKLASVLKASDFTLASVLKAADETKVRKVEEQGPTS